MKVSVIQVDNRPCTKKKKESPTWIGGHDWKSERDNFYKNNSVPHFPFTFWELTRVVNQTTCKFTDDWCYSYLHLEKEGERAPQWTRIRVIIDLIEEKIDSDEMVIYLDTDAWIRDVEQLKTLLEEFSLSSYSILASADPENYQTTNPIKMYFNTGFMAFKTNQTSLQFLKEVWEYPEKFPEYKEYYSKYGYEQSIFNVVYTIDNNKDIVKILPVDVCNTPAGSVVMHNWWKDQLMVANLVNDLFRILGDFMF